jgi:hypothetical protein
MNVLAPVPARLMTASINPTSDGVRDNSSGGSGVVVLVLVTDELAAETREEEAAVPVPVRDGDEVRRGRNILA